MKTQNPRYAMIEARKLQKQKEIENERARHEIQEAQEEEKSQEAQAKNSIHFRFKGFNNRPPPSKAKQRLYKSKNIDDTLKQTYQILNEEEKEEDTKHLSELLEKQNIRDFVPEQELAEEEKINKKGLEELKKRATQKQLFSPKSTTHLPAIWDVKELTVSSDTTLPKDRKLFRSKSLRSTYKSINNNKGGKKSRKRPHKRTQKRKTARGGRR